MTEQPPDDQVDPEFPDDYEDLSEDPVEDFPLGEEEPVEGEDEEPLSYEEATAAYDEDLDDPEDQTTGYENEVTDG